MHAWTEQEKRTVFLRFRYWWPFQGVDDDVEAANNVVGYRAWLRRARKARMLSARSLASKVGISRQALCQLERLEQTGALTIRKMEEVARAMDCEFVYVIRPRKKELFSTPIWKVLFEDAQKDRRVKADVRHRLVKKLGYWIQVRFESAKFRRAQGWSLSRT